MNRFARLSIVLLLLAAFAFPLAGCVASTPRGAEQAYIVNSQGQTSPTARSALAGSLAPGKQEIIGLYLPLGPNLAVKAGLEWDGTPTVIEVPIASQAYYPQAACAPQFVDEQITEMVPETRLVPRTRTVRRALVPVPQAAPPCAPPIQRVCPPPPSPVVLTEPNSSPPLGPVVCTEPGCELDVHLTAAR